MSNNTMSQRMLDAAIAAYSVEEGKDFAPESQYWDPIGAPKESVTTFLGGKHDLDAGFVAQTEDGWLVLSFRGTLSSYDSWDSFLAFVEDWFQDDETKMVPMDIPGAVGVGNVEKGFEEALTALWPQIGSVLDKADWSELKGIQITGHSKGAAMTFLAAAMVKVLYPQAKQIEVYAFAAPLAGDPSFANWYREQNLDATTIRYQRENDLVPFVPPTAAWDVFHHIRFFDSFLAAALKALSANVTGGYEEVGSLVFLPNPLPSTPPIGGAAGESAAQQAIVKAIDDGDGDTIAHAHSATDSYWPAVFG